MGFSEPHAPLDGFHVPMKRCGIVVHFTDGTESVHVLNMILEDGTERVIDRVEIDGETYVKERRCKLIETDSYSNPYEVIHVLECSVCGETCEHVNGSYPRCPNCGLRVTNG